HRFEYIKISFLLESNEKMFPEEHADLFATHLLRLIQVEHLHDDKQVVVVLLDLRTLAGGKHIFQRERREIETRSEGAKNVDVAESVDVDPSHALIVQMRKEFLVVIDGALFEVRTIIFDQGDTGPACSRFIAG